MVLKCKASMLCFQFGLVSVREQDLSDFCREVFVGTGEGVAVPLGPCVMPWLGWAALALLEEGERGEDDVAALPSHTWGKGKEELVLCSVWHAGKSRRYC